MYIPNGMSGPLSAETLKGMWDSLRKSPGNGLPMDIMKAITQSTGLVWYDLEPYAKLLFPVITPLRNEIPRVKGSGDIATHWKSITGINTQNVSFGLGEGHRGGSITTSVVDNLATYKSTGLEDSVTFEADLAAENFDEVKQLSVSNLLKAYMIQEEICIIGGNSNNTGSLSLGVTPTPTLVGAATGGTLANATFNVIVVALTHQAYMASSVSGGVPGSITRTNTDATTDTFGGGSAQKSVSATAATGGSSGSITGTVAAVNGAVAYAWYWGVGAGNEILGAITTINSIKITANATGTQNASALPASDNSQNGLIFDGLLTQICKSGSGAYNVTLPTGSAGVGTPLTTDSAGGISEINTAFQSFWDNYRLSPDRIMVNSQELTNITTKVIGGGGTPLFRFVGDAKSTDQLKMTAGSVVGSYLNKYTMSGGQLVDIMLHPNVPPGTIMFYSKTIPYPMSNVRNLLQMKMRRDYFQIEWPQVRPAYEYGIWANGLLQNYFPAAFGAIRNIANG